QITNFVKNGLYNFNFLLQYPTYIFQPPQNNYISSFLDTFREDFKCGKLLARYLQSASQIKCD
ncbi:hypothetical protein AB7W17_23255, partial [Providencia rettgeri]